MSTPEVIQSVERSREGVTTSLVEAWTYLNLLRGISAAAQAGISERKVRCADQFYRASFSALCSAIGTLLDGDDDVHSLPRLTRRLRASWADDAELLALADEVEAEIGSDGFSVRLTRWRNKVVAHRTNGATDPVFYQSNRVDLEEVAEFLASTTAALNRLSVKFDGVEYHSLESAVPTLREETAELFGR
ncbi:MAG TPA: hypothetical protein PLL78_14895 [Fimbriimonadaceae bacterium]|nr:hypothetical protein [Fimbriimonadaceae bacterium]